MKNAVSTGNEELDARLGGGIPMSSLLLLEGPHGSGKSVLALHIAYGALRAGLKVSYITTEETVKSLLSQASRLGLGIDSFYMKGQLKAYPLYIEGVKWDKESASRLLPLMAEYIKNTLRFWDVMVIDSFSVIASYASLTSTLNFVTKLKMIASRDKLLVLTVHSEALDESIMLRLRSICDGIINLKYGEVGGIPVRIMEIVKLKRALGPVELTIAFDVDPSLGIKILPIALARG